MINVYAKDYFRICFRVSRDVPAYYTSLKKPEPDQLFLLFELIPAEVKLLKLNVYVKEYF